MNNDSIKDLILFFDKYKEATRPDNIQTPILFFLGKGQNSFSFVSKGEKLIFSPYYRFRMLKDIFVIDQNGIGEDSKIYSNFYKYEKGKIVLFKEIVLEKTERLKVDEKTGEVTTTVVQTDTLIKRNTLIPIDKYDIIKALKPGLN